MATIPTTDRKYYDTERKVSAVAEYAGALLPAAKQYQQIVYETAKSHLVAEESKAKLEMNELTTNWRLQNLRNPFNEESLQQLQVEYDAIISQHRDNIDPVLRDKWDMVGNKLKSDFQMSNQTWGFEQKTKNTVVDFNDYVDNTVKLSASNKNATMSDVINSGKQQLIDGASENFPTVQPKVAAESISKGTKNLVQETFYDRLNEHNYQDIYAFIDEQKSLPANQRDVDEKTLFKMEEETKKAHKKHLNERYARGEDIKVLQSEFPGWIPNKNIKPVKTNKNQKEMRYDDFQKVLKEKIRNLKKIYNNESKYRDLEGKAKEDYEFHVLTEMMDLKQQVMNSTKIKEKDKLGMLQTIYATAYDETLRDDVLRIYDNFDKITDTSLWGGIKFITGFGGDKDPFAAIPPDTQFDIAKSGNKAAEQIIDILSQVKPKDEEYNKNLVSQADDVVLSFLKKTLKSIYDFDFVNTDLKVGDTIQIPYLGNRLYTFMGYTANDVLVKPMQ